MNRRREPAKQGVIKSYSQGAEAYDAALLEAYAKAEAEREARVNARLLTPAREAWMESVGKGAALPVLVYPDADTPLAVLGVARLRKLATTATAAELQEAADEVGRESIRMWSRRAIVAAARQLDK